MKTAYIARETIAPAFPEHVEEIVEMMTEDLTEKGYTVEVTDLRRYVSSESEEELETSLAVEKAWESASSRVQDYLMNEGA